MDSNQLRNNFFKFMLQQGHKEVANVSLVPNVDSTLLFVNSGMFPLVPYLQGQPHPLGKRLCNFQRCLRTSQKEIEEIGDNRHTLMFQMMGNWSLGDYFKEMQIPQVMEMYVKYFGLDPKRLYVSVWGGDESAPRDDESIELWKKAFAAYEVNAEFSEDITKIPASIDEGSEHLYRIFPYGKSDNWWKRGEAPGELGGPCTEMFYDLGVIERVQDEYHINDDSGRFVEICNSVFMEYYLDDSMKWVKLSQRNVDFGGGFERLVMCAQNKLDLFETDLYSSIISKTEELCGKPYKVNGEVTEFTPNFRVLADHIRACAFIIADGVVPSNKDQGYILRSLIRRMIRKARYLELNQNFTVELAKIVIEQYSDYYPMLKENEALVLNELEKEEIKFARTLERGLKELHKFTEKGEQIDGEKAFYLYETYGFPIEMIIEELTGLSDAERNTIMEEFAKFKDSHRQLSQAGADKKFKGGLADSSAQTTALHTTHHLLLAALQKVLGEHVKQRGSNITKERLRIDFSHPDKLTPEQLNQVKTIVSEWISQDLTVERIEMPLAEATQIGAQMEFGQSYGDIVSVYFVKNPATGEIISKEFCGGPHVTHTSQIRELGNFNILKEESSGAGIRRIKAVLA